MLLLLIARTVEGSGPGGIDDWLITLGRILAGGIILCAPFAAVSMAVSCLTDRRAIASVAVILFFLAAAAVLDTLVQQADMTEYLQLLNLDDSPYELVLRLYGESGAHPSISTWYLVLSNLGWLSASAGIIWWRYRRLGTGR